MINLYDLYLKIKSIIFRDTEFLKGYYTTVDSNLLARKIYSVEKINDMAFYRLKKNNAVYELTHKIYKDNKILYKIVSLKSNKEYVLDEDKFTDSFERMQLFSIRRPKNTRKRKIA